MVAQRMSSLLKWVCFIFGLVSAILTIVLVVLSRRAPRCSVQPLHPPPGKHDERSRVFSDLTREEYLEVRDFVLSRKELDVTCNPLAKPTENFLFLIDLSLPKKAEVLAFLSGGPPPARMATVVVFHGGQGHIGEYVVGPLPGPTYIKNVTVERYGAEVPINARTVTVGEYALLFDFLRAEVFSHLGALMRESFGVQDDDAALRPFEAMPRGLRSGERRTWVSFFRDTEGFYIHPVGFEVLVDHGRLNASDWTVERVLYNGQYFDSVAELRRQYDAGVVQKIRFRERPNYSSLKPRRDAPQLPPQQVYARGKRFSVRGNHVLFLDWSFAFGLSALTGMRVFDVRFRDQRIVYELSVQEAMSVYGSATPGMALTKFLDSSIGVGRFAHELVRGVDCPYDATYVTTYRYIDVGAPVRFRNSMCVFEHNMGRPLRRHFSDFFHNTYGGMVNSALVLRTITAIGNYDYIWDFIFYQSGSVEAKVHATGYISSSYMVDGALKYGHQVADHVLGNIHTHFVNFKVDMDVLGVKNVFQVKDMEYINVSLPWRPEHHAMIPRLVEKQLSTEQEAALRYDTKTPRYLHIASSQTNRWGHQRSYRLQVFSFTGDHLPESQPEEKAMSWARYKVAITKHKDLEQTSSSLYSQNDIWNPAVDFSKYIEDNESIEDEDLVAWVTTGFLHIPHAEDIPNTVTVGNGGGVILRPHNYFDEDPSIHSPDSVFIAPGTEQSCDTNRMACLAQETCSPVLEPFTYHGFEGVMKFEE